MQGCRIVSLVVSLFIAFLAAQAWPAAQGRQLAVGGASTTTSNGETKAVKLEGLRFSGGDGPAGPARAGLAFSAEVGRLDKTRSASVAPDREYGDVVGNGLLRMRVSDRLTLTGHAQTAADLREGGVGARYGLGRWGVAQVAVMNSQSRAGPGQRHQYAYSLRMADGWQVGVSRDEGDRYFRDLSSFESTGNRYGFRRDTVWTSVATDETGGRLGVAYTFGPEAAKGNVQRELTLERKLTLPGKVALSLTGSRVLTPEGYTLGLKVSLPLETLLQRLHTRQAGAVPSHGSKQM